MGNPWPADALIIVASRPEEAVLGQMDGVHRGTCRDCGTAVLYSGYSRRRLGAYADRMRDRRPIEFLCVACAVRYDPGTIDVFEDHRPGAG